MRKIFTTDDGRFQRRVRDRILRGSRILHHEESCWELLRSERIRRIRAAHAARRGRRTRNRRRR